MRLILHYTDAELRAMITAAVQAQRGVTVTSVRLSVIEARDMHDRPLGTHVVGCDVECDEPGAEALDTEKTLAYCRAKFDNRALFSASPQGAADARL